MKYVISVDAGKFGTKFSGRAATEMNDTEGYFPTKLHDLRNGDIDVEGESHRVKLEGQEFIIGEQGQEKDQSLSKTSMVHRLAIYTAITQIAKEDISPTVFLTIGCPTTIFKNKDLKEQYREYISNNGKAEIEVNGKEYSIELKKVIVKCEGSGIVYVYPELFRNQKVAIIDLGGRNMNFGVYENMVPIPRTLFSNNAGGTLLEADLRDDLCTELGIDIDIDDARRALQDGGILLNGELNKQSSEIVKAAQKKYVSKIMQSIQEKNIAIATMPVIAIGGTSDITKDALVESIPHVKVLDDSQWLNVRGFQIVGLVKSRGVI